MKEVLTKLDILLVGFGAVGAIYALALKRSGRADVTVVARSNYDAAQKNGTNIMSAKYGNFIGWRPHRLCRTVEEASDRAYTHVVICTKNVPEVMRLSELIAPLLKLSYTSCHSQPTYVLFQNGINAEIDLYHALRDIGMEEPKVISAAVYIATNLLDDLSVEHALLDNVSIGVYRHDDCLTSINSPAEDAMLYEFADVLNAGGSDVTVVPEIQRIKLQKNFWNVTFSTISTLTGWAVTSLFRPPPAPGQSYAPYIFSETANLVEEYVIPNVRAVLQEMLQVGRAMGFPDNADGLPSTLVSGNIEMTRKLCQDPNMNHKPSMMLDAENGRPMEVEVIVGEVVRMAKRYKVAIPRIDLIYALLVVKQNQTLRLLKEKPRL